MLQYISLQWFFWKHSGDILDILRTSLPLRHLPSCNKVTQLWKKAREREWIYPLKMVIFHSYVSHYQRINPIQSHKTIIFLWVSYGFPMGFLWVSYGRPLDHHDAATGATDPERLPRCALRPRGLALLQRVPCLHCEGGPQTIAFLVGWFITTISLWFMVVITMAYGSNNYGLWQ